MNFRITTNGVMRNYRSNLNGSYRKLYNSMIKVQTHRQFNSYAEDPAAASRAFQLRRSMWRADDQIKNNNHLSGIYQTAVSALKSVVDADPESDTDNSFDGIKDSLGGITGTAGAGRRSLGQTLMAKADSIVQMMNSQYGDKYIFAGADGLNVPFTWGENNELLYRGVDVTKGDAAAANPLEALKAMDGETVYVDIGLGLEEDANGEIVATSAYNSALSGLSILGYGADGDGDSKNLAVLMKELGSIFNRCSDNGSYQSAEDEKRAEALVGKLNGALDRVSEEYVNIDADSQYLDANLKQLQNTRDNLDEQRAAIEQIDPADAITEMLWGQYCYNAALKIGNDVLSQSLIDYMR